MRLCLLMTVNTMQRFVQFRDFFSLERGENIYCSAVTAKRKPSDSLASSAF